MIENDGLPPVFAEARKAEPLPADNQIGLLRRLRVIENHIAALAIFLQQEKMPKFEPTENSVKSAFTSLKQKLFLNHSNGSTPESDAQAPLSQETISLFYFTLFTLSILSEEWISIRNRLQTSNFRLVLSVASKFAHSEQDCEDYTQVGIIALMNAIKNFDLREDTQFSTYATAAIKKEIRRYIRRNNRNILSASEPISIHIEHLYRYFHDPRELDVFKIKQLYDVDEETAVIIFNIICRNEKLFSITLADVQKVYKVDEQTAQRVMQIIPFLKDVRDLTSYEIQQFLGIQKGTAWGIFNMLHTDPVEIDAPFALDLQGEDSGSDGHDFIEDRKQIDPIDKLISTESADIQAIAMVCKLLEKRERWIIFLRFGTDELLDPDEHKELYERFDLSHSPPYTLEEVGLLLNLTGERIRQIEGKAITKLRGCNISDPRKSL